jgi:hypothetical protein
MTRSLVLISIAALSASLTACSSWEYKENYLASKETQPLNIPPGLDEPNTQAQLVIPPSEGGGSTGTSAPPALSASAETLKSASRVVERDGTLKLELMDPPTAAFPKVATALERGGYAVISRDEAAGRFTVRARDDGYPVEGGAMRRFFKRMTFSDAGRPVEVMVSASGDGSALTVGGEKVSENLSRTLLEQLGERLK